MNRSLLIGLLALMALASAGAFGQVRDAAEGPGGRAGKLRTILRTQDLRSRGDTLLRRYLSDPDSVVRTRATLAYANLQDTTAITALVAGLTDGSLPAQEAAAFAIGQTAAALCRTSAEVLGRDLIRNRLDGTAARDRLVGEIGKFGSERELNDLVTLAGTAKPPGNDALLMAVARFAIRGITTPEGTSYALERFLDPATTGWRAAYALQRIGDDPRTRAELPRLIRAASQEDPLVRMNIAALFGKIKDDSSIVGPLVRIAVADGDWRVRVNALRALGNHPPDERIAGALKSAMADSNASIVLTALSAVAGYGDRGGPPGALSGLLPTVRALARGREIGGRWQYRAGAATALAKLEGAKAIPDLAIPPGADPLLEAGLISAIGATGSPGAMAAIAPYLHSADPLFRRTALEALQSLLARNPGDGAIRDSAYAASIAALESGDMAVATTAAASLGDSLLLRRESVPALTSALGQLRPPADIEAIQEVCRTLGKIGDSSAAGPLTAVLDGPDYPAALAAAAALTSITGTAHSPAPDRDRAPLHTDFDFGYLESLPETIAVRLETSGGEIVMEWYRDAAPFTIMNLLKLAEDGFFRSLVFHRVVPNFVIQGGDPRGDGWGGPGYSVRSEFSPLSYETGTVGIASAGKDTEGSQFFITHSPQPHLDGRYTIIGKVVGGMEVVDRVQVGDRILDLGRAGR